MNLVRSFSVAKERILSTVLSEIKELKKSFLGFKLHVAQELKEIQE